MAKVIKSSHPIRHYATGGLIDALTQPSKESNAAQAEISKTLAVKREAAAKVEGDRLQGVSSVPATKSYTNPDGTPFTRDQMRRHLGR